MLLLETSQYKREKEEKCLKVEEAITQPNNIQF